MPDATMPRKGPQDRRQQSQPVQREVTDAETAQGNTAPYGTCCGHDLSRHRGGRCWTDALGEPLFRARSLIACTCDGLVAS